MSFFSRAAAIAGLVSVISASSASASEVYSNGAATYDSFHCAETSGACSGAWTVFDDFTLNNSTRITAINYTTRLYGGLQDFKGGRAWIYSADPVFGSGVLLSTIALQSGNATANALGGDFYDIHLTGLGLDLSAGSYWIGLQNETVNSFGTIACSNCGFGGNAKQWQAEDLRSRYEMGMELAFSLDGMTSTSEVPEPGSMALLGLGLVGVAALRRRQQNKR